MDARHLRALVLGLAGIGAGCAVPNASLTPTPAAKPATEEVREGTKPPSRQPKAATCVALAELREQEALSPERTPAEREVFWNDARLEYQQALTNEPNNVPALRGLAHLYDALGDHERAMTTYRKAVAAAPRNASLWHEQGMAQARLKEWDAALEALRKAHELDAENRQFTNDYGFTLAMSGHFDESLACFQETGGVALAHYKLARALQYLHQDEMCRQQLQMALQRDPQLVAAQEMLNQMAGTPQETTAAKIGGS